MKVGIAVYCKVCGHRKAPIGRSVPCDFHMCDRECPGYAKEPFVGSLWPGETEEEFGYAVGQYGVVEIAAAALVEHDKVWPGRKK